jgi:mannobiose 2-epimerase
MFTDTPTLKSLPTTQQSVTRIALLVVMAGLLPPSLLAKDPSQYAHKVRVQLIEKILPYWYDTAIDHQNGGYVLSDDVAKPAPPATEKQLVTQARMVWGFSHAHIHGLSDGRRDFLEAAKQGYRFLQAHFLDREQGGYFWTSDLAGQPLDQRKLVYGEAFVIYAFVEYYRASGDQEALAHAMELFNQLQTHAHDAKHGGWLEHFQRDWTPILDPSAAVIVERAGCKSANTHLHLMEALTELCQATGNRAVRKALLEAVKINQTWFYPLNPAESAFHRHLDWKPVTEPASQGLSYGHNVEFAWLLVRAQQVLGQRPAWTHVEAHINHALKYGYDHARGGLYSRGFDDQPATDTDKVWWVQAEMLAALTECLKHKENPAYSQALVQLLDFVSAHQANPSDGIWLDTVKADGTPKVTAKAHNWKANYHDVRALVKFSEALGGKKTKRTTDEHR